jgi:uncharacterized protein YodC (DUF2158 family)
MSVAEFKKKEAPSEPIVPVGTVVVLNSDYNDAVPMTIMESKAGKLYCRWWDDAGNLQGDWFFPAELHMGDVENEIILTLDDK